MKYCGGAGDGGDRRRPPRGGRGLKYSAHSAGAAIGDVAPLAGGVD